MNFFFAEMDMCLLTLSWRLCCLCNNLWTCTEFYRNLNQFLKLWTQPPSKWNQRKVNLWNSEVNRVYRRAGKRLRKSLQVHADDRPWFKNILVLLQCPVYNRLCPIACGYGVKGSDQSFLGLMHGTDTVWICFLLKSKCFDQMHNLPYLYIYMLVAVCIQEITSANKKAFIICGTELSWFSLLVLKSS